MRGDNEIEPADCSGMTEIRAEIDRLDRRIIELLGKRFHYVLAAAKFKSSETAVRAPERLESMLRERRAWAEEQGLQPDVIERLYRDLVTHFIEEELVRWQSKRASTPTARLRNW